MAMAIAVAVPGDVLRIGPASIAGDDSYTLERRVRSGETVDVVVQVEDPNGLVGEFALLTDGPSHEPARMPSQFVSQPTQRSSSSVHREWERWIRGGYIVQHETIMVIQTEHNF